MAGSASAKLPTLETAAPPSEPTQAVESLIAASHEVGFEGLGAVNPEAGDALAEGPTDPIIEEILDENPHAAGFGGVAAEGGTIDEVHNEGPAVDVAVDIPDGADPGDIPAGIVDEDDAAVHFTEEDLLEARERAEFSLLARIFWEEPRELRVVENSFIQVWKCGRVRVFDVGSGLYQFIFPTVIKRNWVLENQPWFFQRSIIHFTDNMTPSEELFHSLQQMLIWVKIIGLPFSYLTIVVSRKLLAKLGEVVKVGYYDAGTPEGCYIKGRVRMDLLGSFLGTAPVNGVNGRQFPAFFQYIGIPCICYLCGWLGHVMAECSRTDLTFDENVRDKWICGKADQNEKESQGPQLQPLQFVPPPHARGRGGLPPSVSARLSSNLQRQWSRDRQARGHPGRGYGGPRPLLALTGPVPILNLGPGRRPQGSGPNVHRPHQVRPLQIMAPEGASSFGPPVGPGSIQASAGLTRSHSNSAASFVSADHGLGRLMGSSSNPLSHASLGSKGRHQQSA
ncbi:Uncharacterized protein At4g02000 [Linum perenne]